MIKYVLILNICSFLSQPICNEKIIVPIEYQNFHNCITQGYIHSYNSLMKMDKDNIERNKLAIKFECKSVEVPEENT
jgi:hypothetical protein|tara:strand:+ start:94 stop:324 length:231 start_codon:yes stop_codon:yes gene_type:complete